MKVGVQTFIEKDIDVTGITLLSVGEYVQFRENISNHSWWWLRSSIYKSSERAACVDICGNIDSDGCCVEYETLFARPALIIKSSHLEIGSKIMVANRLWTVISDRYALCDKGIGWHCFREDWKAKDANDYEASDIKKYIENWWAEQVKKGE